MSPSSSDFWSDFEDWHKFYNAPLPNSSVYAQYCVSRKARELGHKVIISGQGADELLAGYRYHSQSKSVIHRYLKSISAKLKNYHPFTSLLSDSVRNQYKSRLIQQSYSYTLQHSTLRSFEHRSLLKLLYQEDISSMANSIENRVPFLDQDLVSFVRNLPSSDLFCQGATKYIHRKSFERSLPPSIIQDRIKRGFPTPEGKWISHNRKYVIDRVYDALDYIEPYFNKNKLREFLCSSSFLDGSNDKSNVWKIFSLSTWFTQ